MESEHSRFRKDSSLLISEALKGGANSDLAQTRRRDKASFLEMVSQQLKVLVVKAVDHVM
jgi:hypothetical protein